MTPTPDEMARWRELCDAATTGPWRADVGVICDPDEDDDVAFARGPMVHRGRGEHHADGAWRKHAAADAAFIAAARNALPRLLDECERLRGREAISDEAVDRYLRELASVAADRDRLRAGHCLSVIPETFIACGEGGNYCSEACRLRALLSTAARKLDFLLRDYPGDKETAELIAAIKREGLT